MSALQNVAIVLAISALTTITFAGALRIERAIDRAAERCR